MNIGRGISRGVAALGLVAAGFPAEAATQDPTTTGIVAGLGLTAAGGKTTISSGGGAIEATLLDSDAVLIAGDTIRRLAIEAVPQKPVAAGHKTDPKKPPVFVVLGHGDSLDFTAARWLQRRLKLIDAARSEEEACTPKAVPIKPGRVSDLVQSNGKTVVPSITDIPAAIATDISIQGVTVATDDRLLVEAVAIGGYGRSVGWTPIGTEAPKRSVPRETTVARADGIFHMPGQVIDALLDADPIAAFDAHLRKEDEVRKSCPTDAGKAWLTGAQAFDASVTSTDKAPAPIAMAAELLTLANQHPLVLRVVVENSGGTAITRSKIFYTLGVPGAATVSAGLLVSFRLDNPISGDALLTGFVRCAVAPTRFQNVARIIAATNKRPADRNKVACSYITS